MRAVLLPVAASALMLSGAVRTQAGDGAAFHAQVVALYSFQAHRLSSEEIDAKSAALDRFWESVGSNAAEALPWLRSELENPGNPTFFFYDGAKLLLTLSNAMADRELALRSLAKVDLRDIQHADYLRTVHALARMGLDTRQAALKILEDPDFKAFIPLHALTLGQDYALIYMLYAQSGVSFEADLVARLRVEESPQAQRSLLLALWYLMNPSSRDAIAAFSRREDIPAESAQYARRLLARRAGIGMSLTSEESLRAERTGVMQRPISDEALLQFDSLTLELLAKLRAAPPGDHGAGHPAGIPARPRSDRRSRIQ